MSKYNNSVHLEGVLEGFQVLDPKDGKLFANASVVTLHPRAGRTGQEVPSELYERIHHRVMVVSPASDEVLIRSLEEAFLKSRTEDGKPFPCKVDGRLFSNGDEPFVVCDGASFVRNDLIRINGNNRVNISGEVMSTSYTNETAKVSINIGDGLIDSLVSKNTNRVSWDMVAEGKLAKGDMVSITGPLLSVTMSDGHRNIRTCLVSALAIQKQRMRRDITKKGTVSIG